MSEDLKDDFSGATKGLFAAIGLMLLFVGSDMIAEKEGLRLGIGIFVVLIGAACFYAAFAWQSAKKILSAEAQIAIGRFARSRATWLTVLFLLIQSLILSKFVEQRRWPFSYPADPAVYAENKESKPDALRWRAAINLRNGAKAQNGERLTCKYGLSLTGGGGAAFQLWTELQPVLDLAHWDYVPGASEYPDVQLPHGLTILIGGEAPNLMSCATALSNALSDIVPSAPIKTKQNTRGLVVCNYECVELEIGN